MQDHKRQIEQVNLPDAHELSALLVKVSLERDKQSFATLFEYFAPRVKSYIFKLGSDEAMAEELAQQTLLQVWRKAHLFNPDKAAASTWIFRIARNLRLDLLRKEKHYDYDDYDLTLVEDDRDSVETLVDREEHSIIVRSALQKLPQVNDISHASASRSSLITFSKDPIVF